MLKIESLTLLYWSIVPALGGARCACSAHAKYLPWAICSW